MLKIAKANKKSRPLKSNIYNKMQNHHRPGDKKAREIKSAVILEQLYKLKRKGLITEKEYKNREKQIFGP
ncbi:MAG: hypothetical protein K8S14_11155 [Actinomycetia bacterium]|nr:hypothetical protein [Actinomycetes bacterium]